MYVDPALMEYAVALVGATRDARRRSGSATCGRTCCTAPARAPRSTSSSRRKALAFVRGRSYVAAAGRARPRPRRDAPPPRALVRGAGRRRRRRRPPAPDPARRARRPMSRLHDRIRGPTMPPAPRPRLSRSCSGSTGG